MVKKQSKKADSGIPSVKLAMANGKFKDYGPLKAMGNNEIQSTCAASWGPMMRR